MELTANINLYVRKLFAKSQFKESTLTLIPIQYIMVLSSFLVFCGSIPWDLRGRKVLLAPVIAFQKTKNSFKNICQELELNDFFLCSAQIKMAFTVTKPPLIPCISMRDFKAIFKVMNKHCRIQTIKECRLEQ